MGALPIKILLGIPLLLFGILFGLTKWSVSLSSGIESSAGTVMLSALPIILGVQFPLSFLQYDIWHVPTISHYGNFSLERDSAMEKEKEDK